MASQGEIFYRFFVTRLVQKGSTRYISAKDTQNVGSYFWGLMNFEFKEQRRVENKRQAFWLFALWIKDCLINQRIEELSELWKYFDINGKNMWEHFYENSIMFQVNCVL